MIKVKTFIFNPFQENTIILYDNTKECIIVDPGCYNREEENLLKSFIEGNDLRPVKLLNTHCHIDHILGNQFVYESYKLLPEYHKDESKIIEAGVQTAQLYNISYKESPKAENFLNEGMKLKFGESELDILLIPGHSPGHLVFVDEKDNQIIGGDVLFYGSIGRTDLPFGDHDTLIDTIKGKLFTLKEDYTIFPGHGPITNLEFEKKHNPFLK